MMLLPSLVNKQHKVDKNIFEEAINKENYLIFI